MKQTCRRLDNRRPVTIDWLLDDGGKTLATEVKEISKPESATAIGLMMIDANAGQGDIRMSQVKKKKSGGGGLLKWLKMFK